MKVAIGANIQDGPFGGGNQFARALADFLTAENHDVVFSLQEPGIDIILLMEPRSWLRISAFDSIDILRYRKRNPDVLVVHRINECDERKDTRFVNRYIHLSNRACDATVFVSRFLKDLFEDQKRIFARSHVCLNGADPAIFRPDPARRWEPGRPLRLVTHHWGTNPNKGFDIYEHLDQALGTEPWKNRIDFTYIGKLPAGLTFRNTRYLEPLSGKMLAEELARHDVYLTASMFEPGANHNIEGGLCGLPVLFRKSGSIPEYSVGFGMSYVTEAELFALLENPLLWYPDVKDRMPDYPHTSVRTCGEYQDLFQRLLGKKDEIVGSRNSGRFVTGLYDLKLRIARILYRISVRLGVE